MVALASGRTIVGENFSDAGVGIVGQAVVLGSNSLQSTSYMWLQTDNRDCNPGFDVRCPGDRVPFPQFGVC